MKPTVTIILLLLILTLRGQVKVDISICDKVIKIDSNEYNSLKVIGIHLPKANIYKKNKNEIRILTKDTVFLFTDVPDEYNTGGIRYNLRGMDTIKKWVLIERENIFVESIYFLINLRNSKIDTLIGEPIIYGNKIVCLENEYTDDPRRVEIWEIHENRITPLKKFGLAECDFLATRDIILFQKTIYIFDDYRKYWKASVL